MQCSNRKCAKKRIANESATKRSGISQENDSEDVEAFLYACESTRDCEHDDADDVEHNKQGVRTHLHTLDSPLT